MNPIRYFSSWLILYLLVVLAPGVINGDLLHPSRGGEQKEILIIKSKRRVYYPVTDQGLTYTINGPQRLEFISRLAVNSKRRRSHQFSYRILIDGRDTVNVEHRSQVARRIRSIQHSNHYFTYSGNYFVNIPAGRYSVQVLPPNDPRQPLLVRVLGKEFSPGSGKRRVLIPTVHQAGSHLVIAAREIVYYDLTAAKPLQITAEGPGTLKITSRLEFESWMGSEEPYRIQVRDGSRVIGTYYFSTERSAESTIRERSDRVPGKWRSCEFQIPDGKQVYEIRLLESDRTVLVRFLEYR